VGDYSPLLYRLKLHPASVRLSRAMLLQAIIPKEMKRFIFPLLAHITKASAPK
jgi:hypothetical protein